MPDGDLWQALDDNINAKSKASIRITKVKAHTTKADIESGVTTFELKHFNDKVDLLAKDGADRNCYTTHILREVQRRKEYGRHSANDGRNR